MIGGLGDYTFSVYTLLKNIHIAAQIVQDFALVAGIVLLYMGFMKFKRYGEMRTFMSTQMTMGQPLMLIIGGSALMFTPLLLSTALAAIWGNADPISYIPDGSQSSEIIGAIILFIRLLGTGVFIKGWIMLAKAGGENAQPGLRGKALMHLFIGVLMMHYIGTEQLIMQTLGFTSV